MDHYRHFLRQLIRNYMIGSVLAVIGVGGAIITVTLDMSASELFRIFLIMLISLTVMGAAEFSVFYRHMKPIRRMFSQERPSLADIRQAYLQIHRFPSLAVVRIFGPHLLGMSLPAIMLTYAAIRAGWVDIPVTYLGLAALGAVLVAAMHALIEFFLTSQSIRPILIAVREWGQRWYGEDVTLNGRVLVSIQRKFQLSAFLIGTFPLILFTLASQIRLLVLHSPLAGEYWQWAAFILVLGVAFSSLGAWLLSRDIQQPIGDLHQAMGKVEAGDFAISAPDLYSDEFSRMAAGFNHMVTGLRERERTNRQLLQSYVATLAAALDARDAYTAGHSERVARYALWIGQAAGLDEAALDVLERSALLHDIGKIGIRDDVLLKDGKLTDEEFEQIKQHPVLGESILKRIEPPEAMAPLLPGVRSHHERYDGRGYPDGLRGLDIPMNGRILAVADAYDAMTSDRPYRKGMPVEKALSILEEGKGSQWDPEYAQLFIDKMRRDPLIQPR